VSKNRKKFDHFILHLANLTPQKMLTSLTLFSIRNFCLFKNVFKNSCFKEGNDSILFYSCHTFSLITFHVTMTLTSACLKLFFGFTFFLCFPLFFKEIQNSEFRKQKFKSLIMRYDLTFTRFFFKLNQKFCAAFRHLTINSIHALFLLKVNIVTSLTDNSSRSFC